MITSLIQKNPMVRSALKTALWGRTGDVIRKISPYINTHDKILDIGCGLSHITKTLQDKGFYITPLDIVNHSLFDDVKPIVYDGNRMPFSAHTFDVSLLLTVLHHTPDPCAILKEAKRVSKKIIVMEDTFSGNFQKHATYFMDSALNLEFSNHPHTNKTNLQWQAAFKKLGLKLLDVKSEKYWGLFQSTVYYLSSN